MTAAPDVDSSSEASTRERILDVAAELFLERGYEGTSLNEIAARLGISTPSLYWHFKSKQELLYQFLTLEWAAFLNNVEAAVATGDPTSRLSAMAEAAVSFGLRRLSYSRAFIHQHSKAQLHRTLPAKQRRVLGQYHVRYLALCTGIITDGVEDQSFDVADPRMTALVIINMCESALAWYDPNKSMTAEAVAALYADSTLRLMGVRTDRHT